jgi:SAM-dependent methyltransferase
MHASVLKFCSDVIRPEDVAGRTVLEVGSAMINGSVRPQIEAFGPSRYLGLDLAEGPGVDLVCPNGIEEYSSTRIAGQLPPLYDLVVSCEMLEHAERWISAFRAMAHLVAPGGALVLTCRGPGFPYHNEPDHWRFEPSDLWRAAVLSGLWPTVCQHDPQVPGVFLRAEKMFGVNSGPLQPHATNVLAGYPLVRPSPGGAERRAR